MTEYVLEYKTGEVSLIESNVLVKDITDMEVLEFWEERLKKLNQDFAVLYKKTRKGVKYAIYTNLNRKGSVFR